MMPHWWRPNRSLSAHAFTLRLASAKPRSTSPLKPFLSWGRPLNVTTQAKAVAPHQEQPAPAGDREPVVGLEPGKRRARWLGARLDGAEDNDQSGDEDEPRHALFASKIARGFRM